MTDDLAQQAARNDPVRLIPETPRLRRFQEHLIGLIPCDPETARAELFGMNARELLGRYVNWADRFVMPRPRRVVTWEGFLRHGLLQPQHWKGVQLLAKQIEDGADLTPYLSERISRCGYVPTDRNVKRRGVEWGDKDYALNAFETHHLHLTPKGSRELLYVIFSRNDAFFLMLGDHKSFDDGTLAQAVAQSRAGTTFELKGILGPANPRPMREQNKLQRHGLTTAYQVEGRTVLGAFLSTAGTSPLHTMHADRMLRMIHQLEPQIDAPGLARESFERNGKPYPAAPNFEWVMQHCDLRLVDTTTRVGFPMLAWRR